MTPAIGLDDQLKHLYRARQTPELVDVPEFSFLMIDGQETRTSPSATGRRSNAVRRLVHAQVRVQARRRTRLPRRAARGLWSFEEMTSFPTARRAAWGWTMVIRQPPEVTRQVLEETVPEVAEKKQLPLHASCGSNASAEGRWRRCCTSAPTPTRGRRSSGCTAFIEEQGYVKRGSHTRSTSAIRADRSRAAEDHPPPAGGRAMTTAGAGAPNGNRPKSRSGGALRRVPRWRMLRRKP